MKRVLCIAGSPRRNGNTDRLLDALSAGVTDAGGEAIRMIASQLTVEPCRACHACSRTGTCVIRDDMDDVYRAVDEASAVVVATPVFFATVPSGLKALFDRFQPYWARRFVLHEELGRPVRPGAILVVGGGGDPFGVDCAVTPVRSVFGVLGVTAEHDLKIVGPDGPSEIESYPAALKQARLVGQSLVQPLD